jgi:hypothetical protein
MPKSHYAAHAHTTLRVISRLHYQEITKAHHLTDDTQTAHTHTHTHPHRTPQDSPPPPPPPNPPPPPPHNTTITITTMPLHTGLDSLSDPGKDLRQHRGHPAHRCTPCAA